MSIRLSIFVIAGMFLFVGNSFALELQGLVTKNCKSETGIIINVDNDFVEMMNLSGSYRKVKVDEVESLYVFNVVENPFRSFAVDEAALQHLKEIYVDDSEKPVANGWAVRFIEDLVIFYSLEGKSHVHTMADIHKLRPAKRDQLGNHPLAKYKPLNFEFTDLSKSCESLNKETSNRVKPTRILADKISLLEYFSSFRQGYGALSGFQERTYLYARPFLFEKEARLGIPVMNSSQRDEPGPNFPFYYQWSTGTNYRFQSQTVLGSKSHEVLPNLEPVFGVRSDLKSHIFHAVFIGNFANIAAGRPIFLGGGGSYDSEPYTMKADNTVQTSFNYVALMGGDFGPFSASAGLFYPSIGIRSRKQVREVLGSEASYLLRFMFTKPRYRIRAVGSWLKYDRSKPTRDDIRGKEIATPPVFYDTDLDVPTSFKLQAYFLRGGVDWDLTPNITLGGDGSIFAGDFNELRSGVRNTSKFTKVGTQLYVRQRFGSFVSVTAYMNILKNNFDAEFTGVINKRDQSETKFFGNFELLF